MVCHHFSFPWANLLQAPLLCGMNDIVPFLNVRLNWALRPEFDHDHDEFFQDEVLIVMSYNANEKGITVGVYRLCNQALSTVLRGDG